VTPHHEAQALSKRFNAKLAGKLDGFAAVVDGPGVLELIQEPKPFLRERQRRWKTRLATPDDVIGVRLESFASQEAGKKLISPVQGSRF
jgi:hypothetical protein